MKESHLWQFVRKQLESSKPVVLLCVVDSDGSSPGRQGFKMAVTEDDFYGSIGGGIMEHKFVELAKNMLWEKEADIKLINQVHDKMPGQNQSGMICSGEQTNVLMPLNQLHLVTVENILKSHEHNTAGWIELSPSGISFLSGKSEADNFYFELKSESDWIYRETTGIKNHLYIIGGGHCALAFSKLMSGLNFLVHVFDDRPDLSTMKENLFAHEKKVIPDYRSLHEFVSGGKNSYVVIMTFGFRTDDLALRSLIGKDFKYLGILGSNTKMDKLFREWKKDGLPEDKLEKIFSPIGLRINSRTPEEIAVSIAAEIIMVKNNS